MMNLADAHVALAEPTGPGKTYTLCLIPQSALKHISPIQC